MNEKETTGPESCKFFDSCSANLCPLDSRLKEMLWRPEENESDDICKDPEITGLQFVRTQKKIRKATRKKDQNRDDYFSYEMLNRDFVVRKGTEGIDPDLPDPVKDPWKEYRKREEAWLRHHPIISDARKEKMRALGLKSIQSIQKPLSHPSIFEIANPKGIITRLDPQSPQKSIENGGIGK